jgi:hypothetical protein
MRTNRVYIGADLARRSPQDAELLEQIFGSSVRVAGDEDQVGNDYDIVGATVAARAPATGKELVYDQFLPLTGVSGTSIAAGATLDLELKPQRLFRAGALFLNTAAQALWLTALAIGQENQFVASGAIPGTFFTVDSIWKVLSAQTAGPGVSIIASFNNPTAGAVVLSGVFAGKSVVR